MRSVLALASWAGASPQGWFVLGALAAGEALLVGPQAGVWQFAAGGIVVIGELTKRAVNRRRPVRGRFHRMVRHASGGSFPSTHASNYTTAFGFATWLLWRHRSHAALPAAVLSFALVALIGPSRVHSGDHRWSDVAAGYALGLAYLATLMVFAKRTKSGSQLPLLVVSHQRIRTR